MNDAITVLNNTAPGPDEIHNLMIKNLPTECKEYLLQTLNDFWTSNQFPQLWLESTILPISKPGKDRTKPTSYRPISLTSTLCKLNERMVNRRLTWTLDQKECWNNIQSREERKDQPLIIY